MAGLDVYTVERGGMTWTVQLDEADARRLGAVKVEPSKPVVKQRAPANKQRTPENK